MGRPPPVAGEKRGYRARNLRARLVCRLIWAPALSQGAPALLRRPSPSCRSRLDPRRRVDLLSLPPSFSSLPRPLALALVLALVLVISLFSFTSSPASRTPLTRYTRAGACGIYTVSNLFNDKMAVVDLLTPPAPALIKVILISPFPSR